MKSKVLLLFCLLLNPATSASDPEPFKIHRFRMMSVSNTSTIQHPELDQHFENGTMEPWVDCSEYGTQWVIQKISTTWDNEISMSHISPPPPESGTHYLWLKQDLEIFGFGVLSSTKFLAYPGDELQFSFWIHSSFEYFNNLQVFWSAVGTKEDRKLVEHFPSSSSSDNTEWRQSLARIPVSKPTEGEIMIYGFCEPKNGAGFIAVDNIFLIRESAFSTKFSEPTTNSKSEVVTKETEFSNFLNITPKMTLETQSTLRTTDVSLSTVFTEFNSCPFPLCEECEKTNDDVYDLACPNVYTKQLRDDNFQQYEEGFYELGIFDMTPPFNDSIPFDMFASAIRYVNWFRIFCHYIPGLYEVDPFAFQPNLDVGYLVFEHCNFVNLTFLSQMNPVLDLQFTNSSNLHNILNTYPENFQVGILRFVSCNLLDLTADDFPYHSSSAGLNELRIYENPAINDDIVDLFISWALDFSRETLHHLYFHNNGLKKMPTGLSRFIRMTYFRFDGNVLETGTVKKGELRFSDYTRLVNIWYCGIHTIEPGAFGGIYEMANVYLDGNNLTRFEAGVFQDILTQMELLGDLEDGGFISVFGNPFDCVDDPCHLTWLLRDNNRSFLPFVWEAACANGTRFEDIQPDDPMFNDCP